MKRFIVLALAFSLSGCVGTPVAKFASDAIAAVQNFTITQDQLDAARSGYDGAVLAPLHKYSSLPRCKTGQALTINAPCHDRVLLKKLRTVDKQIDIAFSNVQARVSSNDNTGASAAYSTLQEAIATAKAIINQTGVNVLGF